MARTLKNLQDRIANLIKEQGEDAPVAAFIFTQDDVFILNDDGEQVHQPLEVCNQVLSNVEDDYDYLYTEIFECIDRELEELKIQ